MFENILIVILLTEMAVLYLPKYVIRFLIKKEQYAAALKWAGFYKILGIGFSSWRGGASLTISYISLMMSNYDLAQEEAEIAVEFYKKKRFTRNLKLYRALAKGYLSIALVSNGDRSELERAEILSRETLDEPVIKGYRRVLFETSAIVASLGMAKLEEAQELIQSLEKTLKSLQKIQKLDYFLNASKAKLFYLQDRREEALKILDNQLPTLTRGTGEYLSARNMRIWCLSEADRVAESENNERDIRGSLEKLNAVQQASCLLTLSLLALDKKDVNQARHYAEQAAEIGHSPGVLAESMLIQAEVFAYYKNPNRALALCHQAVELFPVPVYKARADRIAKRLESDVLEQNEDANLLRISNQAG